MTSLTDKKRLQILQLLDSRWRVELSDLIENLGASEASIRRDLVVLEEMRLLKRVQDGAVAMPHYRLGKNRSARMNHNREHKERIGRAAADLIRTGDCVLLDSGTTSQQVAAHICSDLRLSGGLTVYTASLPIFREIGACPGIRLVLLGGIYMRETEALAGPQTVDNLRELRADKVFLGADGITLSNGVTTSGVLEADVDRYMLTASKEVIVVSDSSKIGVIGLVSLIQLDHVDTLVTDSDAPPEFVEKVRQLGVKVVLA